MTKERRIIAVPKASEREGWEFIDDMPFTAEDIVEIVKRYCNLHDINEKSRIRRQEEAKVMKAFYLQHVKNGNGQ